MSRSQRSGVLALAAALLLSACSSHGSGITPPAANAGAPSPYTGPASLADFTYGAESLTNAQYIGPASTGTLGVNVELRLHDASGLVSYAAQASDPSSPLYRHFLTPQEIGARYGASPSDLAAVASYFESYHLHVGGWPQRLALFVWGPQKALEAAFGTTFGLYRQGDDTFIAPRTAPHFTRALPVSGVTRLVTAQRSFRDDVPLGGGSLTTSGYSPQQIRNAFDYTGAYKAGFNGSGITVGVIGTGPMSPADVPAYGAMFDTDVATVTQVDVTDSGVSASGITNGVGFPESGFSTPPPVTAPCAGSLPACNPEDVEAQIDTEAVASLAPGSNVLFYLAYSDAYCSDANGNITPAPCTTGQTLTPLLGITLSDDEIQQAIADNNADILSLSYGGPEAAQAAYEFDPTDPTQGLGPDEFAALAAEGIAVFVSSGDSGAEGCQRPAYQPAIDQTCVSYPATDPNVTSVGGVTAPLDRFGNLTNQIIGWGLTTSRGHGGSGGGISAYFAQSLTPWQQGMPGVQGAFRNDPDVSLLGDNATGMAALTDASLGGPVVQSVGGTSVAAPEMAAMWALVLQACKSSATCAAGASAKPYRLGNPAPLLYSLYAKNGTIAPTYAQTFYDVLYGDNQQVAVQPSPGASPLDAGYQAGPGYDLVSGLGVPFARSLIKAVTKQ